MRQYWPQYGRYTHCSSSQKLWSSACSISWNYCTKKANQNKFLRDRSPKKSFRKNVLQHRKRSAPTVFLSQGSYLYQKKWNEVLYRIKNSFFRIKKKYDNNIKKNLLQILKGSAPTVFELQSLYWSQKKRIEMLYRNIESFSRVKKNYALRRLNNFLSVITRK